MSLLTKKRKITEKPKLKRKTHSGAKKRLNVGPSKLTYMSIGTRHKLVNKSNRNKRSKNASNIFISADSSNVLKYFFINNKSLKRRRNYIAEKKAFYNTANLIHSSDFIKKEEVTDAKS